MTLPKISLVTAVYNGGQFLEDTIRSILYQEYPNLEYVIVNDGSTDGTEKIIQKYESQVTAVIRQENRGLYAALNAGFARTTGGVMGWLNSSDKLHTGGLFVVGSVFLAMRDVEWITGRPTGYSTSGMTTHVNEVARWSRGRFLAGANKYIQQESTYWRRSLWEKSGGALDESLRAEGDFELWVRFFRFAKLHSVDALIAGYRVHADALSFAGRENYDRVCEAIVERELVKTEYGNALRAFRKFSRAISSVPIARTLWRRLVIDRMYRMRGPDWPPKIAFDHKKWIKVR